MHVTLRDIRRTIDIAVAEDVEMRTRRVKLKANNK